MDILKQHMGHYIDAEKLIAKIERLKKSVESNREHYNNIPLESRNELDAYYAQELILNSLIDTIDSLQQEQPEVDLKTGIELIAAERKRQIEVEGWSKEHDAEHASESLALAAVCYAMPDVLRVYSYDPTTAQRIPEYWPWDRNSWKPSPENRIKELVKAGALIAAEIDKLNARKEQPEGGCSEKPNDLLSKI